MKYNYEDMSNISDIIGMELHYSESFKSALGEPVSTGTEVLTVESMTEPGNVNGGIIHWLSFGGGRGIYMEETQIIDVLNKKEINIAIEGKIATLSLIDTPSSVTYEVDESLPPAAGGRRGVRTSALASGWREESDKAERLWTNWSSEERDRFLVKYLNAIDSPGKYYELVGLEWPQLSDNLHELIKIEARGDGGAPPPADGSTSTTEDGTAPDDTDGSSSEDGSSDEEVPAAESGIIVGHSDINGRDGERAIIGGKVWKVGGGEIIMSEKASHDNCEELSRMNVEAGGKAFSCDEQEAANIDRASGAMPKDEYHKEAAGGTRASAQSLESIAADKTITKKERMIRLYRAGASRKEIMALAGANKGEVSNAIDVVVAEDAAGAAIGLRTGGISSIPNFNRLSNGMANTLLALERDGKFDRYNKITIKENPNKSLSVLFDGKDFGGRSFYDSWYDQQQNPQRAAAGTGPQYSREYVLLKMRTDDAITPAAISQLTQDISSQLAAGKITKADADWLNYQVRQKYTQSAVAGSASCGAPSTIRYNLDQTPEHNIAIVLSSGKELKWLSQSGVNEFKRKYPKINFTTK